MREVALISRKGAAGSGRGEMRGSTRGLKRQGRSRIHAKQHYFAFLSYSHADQATAEWLHEALESFRVPRRLVGKLTENGVIPRRLTPVFRDRGELAASDDLSEEIEEALAGSRFMIVLCSPAAVASRWTNAEIAAFKRLRPDGEIFAAIVDGEPLASAMPGREAEECFPAVLTEKYDSRGRPTGRRAEPIAADLRGEGEARRLGLMQIIAGMLGVGLDELVQREGKRRQHRMQLIAVASLVGMLIAFGLAFVALQSRDAARDQRREAESLVEFMLGDLRDKLEPIGQLEALDGVGTRVLEYYSKQDMSELTDAALLQRSQALSLMAEVATAHADVQTALRLYGEAMEGTAEAIRRNPKDPQRLFDHAQNIFYIAQIARSQGDTGRAERALREYKHLAARMVALEPDNMRWRMEAQYGDFNLGVALYDQQRYAESAALFGGALQTIQALSTADPNNDEYQQQLSEALAWLADARLAMGQIEDGRRLREQHVTLLRNQIARTRGAVNYRQRLVLGYQRLGNLYAALGRPEAEQTMRAAVRESESLVAVEAGNNRWREHGSRVRLRLAEYLLTTGSRAEAASFANKGCAIIAELVAKDRSIAQRQATRRDCLLIRAKLAISGTMEGEPLSIATAAADAAKQVETNDSVSDVRAIAEAHRLVGDAHQLRGDTTAAERAWKEGLAALATKAGDHPSTIAERAELLARLGDRQESARLKARLSAMGIRRTNGLRV